MDRNRGPERPATRFEESEYCYGSGALLLRIERIDWGNAIYQDGATWYEVEGMEVSTDGREIGRRRALVRAQRLAALAPPNRRRP